MNSKLKSSPQIWQLAADLGLRPKEDPVASIVEYCKRRVRKMLPELGACDSLSKLLDWVGARLETAFEEIQSDEDLQRIKQLYCSRGETGFANLEIELSDEVFGITFRRLRAEPWENKFVSVIDCRGNKAQRSYFTKWHEVAHLLALTAQRRLAFRRTHATSVRDPEESLMDIVAGQVAFLPEIVGENLGKEISFEEIDRLRAKLCPQASFYSSVIGFVQSWPRPCVLVEAKLAAKKSEARVATEQSSFGFIGSPRLDLRAVKVSPNPAARDVGIQIFNNMRVPRCSVISEVFRGTNGKGEQVEDLSWWETSQRVRLQPTTIQVKARKYLDSVLALIIPVQ